MSKTAIYPAGTLVLLKNGMYVEIQSHMVYDTVLIYQVSDITSNTDNFPANVEYIDKEITNINKEVFLSLPISYNTARLFAYYGRKADGDIRGNYIRDFWFAMVCYMVITMDESGNSKKMQDVYDLMLTEIPYTLTIF